MEWRRVPVCAECSPPTRGSVVALLGWRLGWRVLPAHAGVSRRRA